MAAGNNGDCDTELCLATGGRGLSSAGPKRFEKSLDDAIAASAIAEQQQKITILYGGQLCVCDVTEIQAKAILCMARREMRSSGREPSIRDSWPKVAAAQQLLNPGQSMKRSLQRFLQKRKARVCERGPYEQQKHHSMQSSTSSSSS